MTTTLRAFFCVVLLTSIASSHAQVPGTDSLGKAEQILGRSLALNIASLSVSQLDPPPTFKPGSYTWSFDNGDGTGRRNWRFVLSQRGTIEGNLRWGSRNLNVSGIWKFEDGSVWIQWQGGDFKGTPKWHKSEDFKEWKRVGG